MCFTVNIDADVCDPKLLKPGVIMDLFFQDETRRRVTDVDIIIGDKAENNNQPAAAVQGQNNEPFPDLDEFTVDTNGEVQTKK